MEVICKKEYKYNDHVWFHKGYKYIIEDKHNINNYDYWIKVDNNNNIKLPMYQKFCIKKTYISDLLFEEYFYTKKEERKIKLRNINKL